MITFVAHGTPRPAGSKRVLPAGGKRGGRPIVVDDNPNSREWKRTVAAYARQAMGPAPLLDGPLVLELDFVLERPKRHYLTHGLHPNAPAWPAVRPDVLKYARAVEDALTGIVYSDDGQIVVERLVKRYGARPGVFVSAFTVDELAAREPQPLRGIA